MAKIHRLSDHLANQIAAGEVVERPSSAAKELVENALDAGARRIDVVAGDGGRQIRVSDDGEGMAPDDAALAFERFATSKIRQPEDLCRIRTLGFRGEALASIAAVARVELITRRAGDEAGTRVKMTGGLAPEIGPHGCPEGTTMAVDDLFFNTPARLKFMKSAATELGHVAETMTALALAHPRVGFTCRAGNRAFLDTSGARDLAEAAALVLGTEIGPRLLATRAESSAGLVEGLIAPPELIRGDRSKQWLIINGRPVRHPALARAIEEAYFGHIPESRHPLYVVAITLDPERVDFNVHPTKKEARLADAALLFGLVREAVGRSLRQLPAGRHPGPARRDAPAGFGSPPRAAPGDVPAGPLFARRPLAAQAALELYRPAGLPETERPTGAWERGLSPRRDAELEAQAPGRERADATTGRDAFPWDDLRLLGQIHDTYVVFEHPDGLYLVDQHNSHERYLYESLGPGAAASQELLLPRELDLGADAADALRRHAAPLGDLGFHLAPTEAAPGSWHLIAVPATLPAEEAERTLLAILGDLAEGGDAPMRDMADRWRVTVACHSAIKAGDRLDERAMRRLLEQWRTCEQPFTCPHGRPTSILIPLGELHRRCMRGMQTR